jgi:hypothetical protein
MSVQQRVGIALRKAITGWEGRRGGSYLSSHDPRMVLGIGKRTKIDWLEVEWPDWPRPESQDPDSAWKEATPPSGGEMPG